MNALTLIEREFEKQQERWGPDHDDQHTDGSLAIVAACYAARSTGQHIKVVDYSETKAGDEPRGAWPWDTDADMRGQRGELKLLIMAGAFIASEIERKSREIVTRHINIREGGCTPLRDPYKT